MLQASYRAVLHDWWQHVTRAHRPGSRHARRRLAALLRRAKRVTQRREVRGLRFEAGLGSDHIPPASILQPQTFPFRSQHGSRITDHGSPLTPDASRFVFEAMEPRLLLSAAPAMEVLPAESLEAAPAAVAVQSSSDVPLFTEAASVAVGVVKDIAAGSVLSSFPANLTNVNGTLYFAASTIASGSELWKSDGTDVGTVLVKDISTGIFGSGPANLTNVNGTLFFSANDGVNGAELWKSNGTAAGTVLVENINPGGAHSSPSDLTNVNGRLLFTADDGVAGREVWESQGTAVTTSSLGDLNPGAPSSNPSSLTAVGSILFFNAFSPTIGAELRHRANGAALIVSHDIWTGTTGGNPNSSNPANLTNVGGQLYFTANDGVNGAELWKSNGAGTVIALVKDIRPGLSGSSATNLTDVNGTLFFSANDGVNGAELWKSDGTAAGTVLVKDIRPGIAASSPANMVNVNGTLFFSANDGVNGVELWKSDGTAAGTVLVKDIVPGVNPSSPADLTNVNGTLFFSAFALTSGVELWMSDGMSVGTVLVADIASGSADSVPDGLTNVNGRLFFSATNSGVGRELWATFIAPQMANSSALVYPPGQTATPINTILTVMDQDSTNFTGATVQITGNYQSGQDVVGFTNQLGITGSFSAGAGTLTLAGTSTVANYQTALRSVTFFTGSTSTATRTVSYQVNDGGVTNNLSNVLASTITIIPPPVLVNGSTLNFIENQPGLAINTVVTVSDADNTTLASGTVSLTANYVNGQDVLGFTNVPATMGNIAGSFNATTGVLTLTSAGATATLAQWQAALRAVTYRNTSEAPNTLTRTVSYQVNDGLGNSNVLTSTITVGAVNDAPQLFNSTTINYAVNQAATAINTIIQVSDVDSSLVGATVQITGNYVNGQDILGFNNQLGIAGSFNAATGTLTLTGVASASSYQTALRAVTYFNTSATPSMLARTVSYRVSDSVSSSSFVTGTINIITATTVTNANDSGAGSLRQAILNANTQPGLDTISFMISGAGVKTIAPLTALPAITDALIIDGTTQPGYAGTPLIELNGTSAGAGTIGLLVVSGGSGSTIKGLAINRFTSAGIWLDGNSSGNVITSNFIGTDPTGTIDLGNASDGIVIASSANNTIGGTTASLRNVISGNNGDGIEISNAAGVGPASGNVVLGNYIGTNAAGTAALANGSDGIRISTNANSNTIGGTTAGAGNVISGNGSVGVEINVNSSGNFVQGNFIGTNAPGTAAISNASVGIYLLNVANTTIGGTSAAARNVISGNTFHGIQLDGSTTGTQIQGNYIGLNKDGNASIGIQDVGISINNQNPGSTSNNTIGGTAAGARNVISGNEQNGVQIIRFTSSAVSNNVVEGNYIGTDAGGTVDLGNGQFGVALTGGVTNNRIGGTSTASRNVISGNQDAGVYLADSGTTGNVVQGNYVGLTAGGAAALGNGNDGVRIISDAGSNTIGGTAAGAGNVIAFNGQDGIALRATAGTGNAIQNNSVHSNGQLGIDLSDNGVTLNDAADTDTGPNNLQNFPVLTSTGLAGTTLEVQGTLTSAANATYTVEFFANSSADSSGFGEGQTFLGRLTNVTTNGSGVATFTFTQTSSPVSLGQVITATATNSSNNTSEFSATSTVLDPNDAPVNTVPGAQSTPEDTAKVFSSGNGNLIAISDVDAGTNAVQVTLTGTNGTITLNGTSGLTFSVGDGTSDATMTFTGTITTINARLNGLSFAPTDNFNGTATLQIVTNDQGNTGSGGALSDTDTVNITVSAVTDPPVAVNDGSPTPLSIMEDTPTSLNVVANDTDVDGPFPLRPVNVSDPPHGTVVVNANGTITYTPDQDYTGPDSFTYQAQDAGGMTSQNTATVFLNVTAVNDSPVLTNNGGGATAAISIPENSTAVTTLTSTDVDGGAPVYSLIGGSDQARFSLNASTGVLAFLTSPDFDAPTDADANNVYEVTVQVSDGAGGTDQQALSISVTNIADSAAITTTSDVADGDTSSIEALNVSPGPDGLISLREAILAANHTPNGNTLEVIAFGLAGAGPHTIQPNSALPTIMEAVVIDGTTQPGYAGTPLIELSGVNAGVGVNGLVINAAGSGTTIRGLAINQFDGAGTRIDGGGFNLLEGNVIGTDAAGTAALGNGDGVLIVNSANNLIGGLTAAARNLISGNSGDGLELTGSLALGNQILGNFIGTDVTGAIGLPNGANGILIAGASGTTIGDAATTTGTNRIAFNSGAGVAVSDGVGNRLQGNAIFGNGTLGLDLGADGVTMNDSNDADGGANNLQNFPVVTSAWVDGTVMNGALSSAPNRTFTLEFFANPSGQTQGERALGRAVVTTDASGTAGFQVVLNTAVTLGEMITATATDSLGNTSEFSAVTSSASVTAAGVATFPLTMRTNGTGQGNVKAISPAGIDLDAGDFTERYPRNTLVTLEATPDPGFEFAGWSGFGLTASTPRLTVPVYDARTYTATFVPANSGERVPPTVGAVQVRSHWANSLTVTWDPLVPPDGWRVISYNIYLTPKADPNAPILVALTDTGTSYTFTELEIVQYQATVTAVLQVLNNPTQTTETGHSSPQTAIPNRGLQGWQIRDEGTDPPPATLLVGRSDWSNVDVDTRYGQYAGLYDYGQFSSIATPTDQGIPRRGSYIYAVGGVAQGRRDYELTLKMSSLADGALGVMLRWVDPDNYYRFSMERGPNRDDGPSDAYMRLIKMQNGQATVLPLDDGTPGTATDNFPAELVGLDAAYLTGNPYTVTLNAVAPLLTVQVQDQDGRTLVDWTVTDTTFTGNGLALYSSRNPGSLYHMDVFGRSNPDPDLLDIDVSQEGTGHGEISSTVNGEVGSLVTNSTTASIARGASVTITATPDPGSVFDGWYSRSLEDQTEELLTADPTVTLPPLEEDQTLVAVFSGAPPPPFTLDLNGDGIVTAETDGRVALKYLGGVLPEGPLSTSLVSPQATTDMLRPTGADVKSWLDTSGLTMLDVDLDGRLNPFTDGRLIHRFLQQRDQQIVDDAALLNGSVLGATAKRGVTGTLSERAAEIRAFLNQYLPVAPLTAASSVISSQSSVSNLDPQASESVPVPTADPEPRTSDLVSSLSVSAPALSTQSSALSTSSVVPMGFASTFSVQAAALTDDTDSTPLTALSRPWLSDFVVNSSVLTDDPNRDLAVALA